MNIIAGDGECDKRVIYCYTRWGVGVECTREAFLKEFGISEVEFIRAEMPWEDLLKIEENYISIKSDFNAW